MEYWPARIATRSVACGSVGVLRDVRIAPHGRRVGGAEGEEGGPFSADLTVVSIGGQLEKLFLSPLWGGSFRGGNPGLKPRLSPAIPSG
jgi:hypothetical protein